MRLRRFYLALTLPALLCLWAGLLVTVGILAWKRCRADSGIISGRY